MQSYQFVQKCVGPGIPLTKKRVYIYVLIGLKIIVMPTSIGHSQLHVLGLKTSVLPTLHMAQPNVRVSKIGQFLPW
jgi:hypothetical protein